jgi:hypothetical protein
VDAVLIFVLVPVAGIVAATFLIVALARRRRR